MFALVDVSFETKILMKGKFRYHYEIKDCIKNGLTSAYQVEYIIYEFYSQLLSEHTTKKRAKPEVNMIKKLQQRNIEKTRHKREIVLLSRGLRGSHGCFPCLIISLSIWNDTSLIIKQVFILSP